MPDSSSRYEHYLRMNAGEFGSMEEFPRDANGHTVDRWERSQWKPGQRRCSKWNKTRQARWDREWGKGLWNTSASRANHSDVPGNDSGSWWNAMFWERCKAGRWGDRKAQRRKSWQAKENTVDTKEQSAEAKKKSKGLRSTKPLRRARRKPKPKPKQRGQKRQRDQMLEKTQEKEKGNC